MSWASQKQPNVSMSPVEAEYVAATTSTWDTLKRIPLLFYVIIALQYNCLNIMYFIGKTNTLRLTIMYFIGKANTLTLAIISFMS